MWRKAFRAAVQAGIHIAALLFAMTVALAVVLLATGIVDRAKLRSMVAIGLGEAEAVETGALADLRASKEEQERDLAERPERTVALRVAGAESQHERRREELARSEAVLRLLVEEIGRREGEVDARIRTWEARRKLYEEQRLAEEERARAAALARVKKILAGLDPVMIAASYQAKYTGVEPKAKEEVLDDFRMLKEPFVAEILAAFAGPEAPKLRLEILDRLKKPPS